MLSPIGLKGTEQTLDALDALMQKIIAHARGREIDEQQVVQIDGIDIRMRPQLTPQQPFAPDRCMMRAPVEGVVAGQ